MLLGLGIGWPDPLQGFNSLKIHPLSYLWPRSLRSQQAGSQDSVQAGQKQGQRPALLPQSLKPKQDFCCSVTQLCLTLCNPMDDSMPSFPVHHHLPEFAQTHVHQVGDAIQPFHPLLSLSPSIFPSISLFQ